MASLSVQLCAFTVAIAVVCKPFRSPKYEWSIDKLTDELQSSAFAADPNFRVDMLPLHQGLNIFKKSIESLEHVIISVSGNKDVFRTEAFMDLPAIRRESAIIFSSAGLDADRTRCVLISKIAETANFLLTRTFKENSTCTSISEIFGVLWVTQLDAKGVEPNKRRKLGADMGVKQMNYYGRQVYDFVSTIICAKNESPSVYIQAGAKYSASISKRDLKQVRSNLFEEEDNSEIENILSNPAVIESMRKFPRKYVKFTITEVELVLSLFDVIAHVRSENEGAVYRVDNTYTADITMRALCKHARYSELAVRTILRWNDNRDVVRKAAGKKISVQFEADVWGKLMICELEQKNVSCIKTLQYNLLLFCAVHNYVFFMFAGWRYRRESSSDTSKCGVHIWDNYRSGESGPGRGKMEG